MDKVKLIIAAMVGVFLTIGGYYIWQCFKPIQQVTVQSQNLAQTPAGVRDAANNAHVNMLQSQLEEAARQIAILKNKPPETIVRTIPVEVTKVIESERVKTGADFAIVTDPKQPDKKVDLKEIEKLPESTTVNLNQYNIKAYPQHLAEVTLYSAKDYDAAYLSKIKVLGATGYVGPVISRTDNNMKIGVRVTVPF